MSQLELPQISLNNPTPDQPIQRWGDALGLIASVGCAIHCAATPIVIALLPTWGLSWLAHDAFHQWMFAACFLIAIVAFVPGLRRHGSWLPMQVGFLGLIFIGVAAFVPGAHCCHGCVQSAETAAATSFQLLQLAGWSQWWEKIVPWVTPLGGGVLVAAHLLNHRLSCSCTSCLNKSH